MIQTNSIVKQLEHCESQQKLLHARIDVLESQVGWSHDVTAAPSSVMSGAELISEDEVTNPPGKTPADPSLLQSAGAEVLSAADVKARVAKLESAVRADTSAVEGLENQVLGSVQYAKAPLSMLQADAEAGAETGTQDSIEKRVIALDKSIGSLRTRVSNIEHVLAG